MNNTIEEILSYTEAELLSYYNDIHLKNEDCQYLINEKGELCLKGDTSQPLCNFFIIPIEKVFVDKENGTSSFNQYSFIGVLKNREKLKRIDLSEKKLSNYKWIEEWSAFCTIYGNKKRNYDLIKDCLSYSLETIQIKIHYDEVGWSKIDNKWLFLHSDGVIDNGANMSDRFGTRVKDFRFKVDKNIYEKEAFNKTIQMLDICNKETTLPLLSYSLLSLIATPLISTKELAPNFSMWLYGKSGIGKTSIASLFTTIFCNANLFRFESYKNVIKEKLVELKDCIFIMDDYGTSKTTNEERKMIEKTEKIIRLLGDRGLSGDDSIAPSGLVLFTGESFMKTNKDSHSSMSRCIRVEMDNIFNASIDNYNEIKKNLFNYYKENNFLSSSMYYYIKWLSLKLNDNFLENYQNEFNKNRERLNFKHSRYVDSYTHLFLSYQFYLEYGLLNNYITPTVFYEELETAKTIFLRLIENQSKPLPDADIEFFFETFGEMISNNIIRVKVKNKYDPYLYEKWMVDDGELGILYTEDNKLVVYWEYFYRKVLEYVRLRQDIYKENLAGIKVLGGKLRDNLYVFDYSSDRTYTTIPKTVNINGRDERIRTISFDASKVPQIVELILDKNINAIGITSQYDDYNYFETDEDMYDYDEETENNCIREALSNADYFAYEEDMD